MDFSTKNHKPFVGELAEQSSDTVRDIDLTAMINVVFLLLIFFMVAGVFRTAEKISVSLPETQLTLSEQENASPEISIDALGSVLINGSSYPSGQFADAIRALDENSSLVIRADASASASKVIDLLSLAKAAGFKEVGLQMIRKPFGRQL